MNWKTSETLKKMDNISPQYIAFCGGIGVGKTTLIERLSNIVKSCHVADENTSGNLYLNDFYENPSQWSFHSRIAFLAIRTEFYKKIPRDKKIVLIDRCVHELVTFARLHYESGLMSERDFITYTSLYSTLVYSLPKLDKVIYVHCSPETALKRIANRGRDFEKNIKIEYLKKIMDSYESWLNTLDLDVIRVDTEKEVDFDKIATKITC